jgi:hypothetical protein
MRRRDLLGLGEDLGCRSLGGGRLLVRLRDDG